MVVYKIVRGTGGKYISPFMDISDLVLEYAIDIVTTPTTGGIYAYSNSLEVGPSLMSPSLIFDGRVLECEAGLYPSDGYDGVPILIVPKSLKMVSEFWGGSAPKNNTTRVSGILCKWVKPIRVLYRADIW